MSIFAKALATSLSLLVCQILLADDITSKIQRTSHEITGVVHIVAPASDIDAEYLTVPFQEKTLRIPWRMPESGEYHDLYPFEIIEGEEYTLLVEIPTSIRPEILGTTAADGTLITFTHLQQPRILKAARGHQVVYDASICERHHVPMKRKAVRISYGMLALRGPQPTREEVWQLFPHYSELLPGGCTVQPTEFEAVYICDECVYANLIWQMEQYEARPAKSNSVSRN